MKIVYISHMHLRKDFPLENIGGIQRMSTELLDSLEKEEGLKIIPMLCYADREHMALPATAFWIRMMLILHGHCQSSDPAETLRDSDSSYHD